MGNDEISKNTGCIAGGVSRGCLGAYGLIKDMHTRTCQHEHYKFCKP